MSLYFNNVFYIMICSLPVYCVGRAYRLWRRKTTGLASPMREILLAEFVLFIIGLISLTCLNGQEWMRARSIAEAVDRWNRGIGVNTTPFRTISNYIRYATDADYLWENIIGNVALFVPWGMGLPLLWKRFQSSVKMVFLCLIFPVGIEFCQLFLGRSVDIDDVILNFIGGVLGTVLYLVIRKKYPKIAELAK